MHHHHDRADQRGDRVMNVIEVVGQRTESEGRAVSLGVRDRQVVVDLVEIFVGLFLVAEDLDDFLSFDHLFDIAVEAT